MALSWTLGRKVREGVTWAELASSLMFQQSQEVTGSTEMNRGHAFLSQMLGWDKHGWFTGIRNTWRSPSSCDEDESLPPVIWCAQSRGPGAESGSSWLRLGALTTAGKRASTGHLCQLQGSASSLGCGELHWFSSEGSVGSFWRNDPGIKSLLGLPWNGVLRVWYGARGISSTRKLLLGHIGLRSWGGMNHWTMFPW